MPTATVETPSAADLSRAADKDYQLPSAQMPRDRLRGCDNEGEVWFQMCRQWGRNTYQQGVGL
jgi:hypothetical protein